MPEQRCQVQVLFTLVVVVLVEAMHTHCLNVGPLPPCPLINPSLSVASCAGWPAPYGLHLDPSRALCTGPAALASKIWNTHRHF